MTSNAHLFFSALAIAASVALSCSAPPGGGGGDDDEGSTGGTVGSGGGFNLGSGGTFVGAGGLPIDQEPTAACSDGVVDPDEACDDGNMNSDDGCGSNCRYVEPGFVCPDPGEPCRRFAVCGDGTLLFPEQCDDGGVAAGDGCSATCKFEIGWTCDGASPSACTQTVCGDGVQEGAETCEQADGMPFDGCSLTCQAEPVCTEDGCTSACGDGLMLGAEECDDGNATEGDGCSATCTQEPGYVCAQPAPCSGPDCVLELPIIFRDFTADHTDFGVGCGQQKLGVAEDVLSPAGKPVLANSADVCIASAASFAEWYTASPNNAEIVSTIKLYDNGDGGYVNRYGPNGEQFPGNTEGQGRWCGNAGQFATCEEAAAAGQCNPPAFDPLVDTCYEVGATIEPGMPPNCCTNCLCAGSVDTHYYDGNPLFLPIDDAPEALPDTSGGMSCAKIPEEVYEGGWLWEDPSLDEGDECTAPLHNFHFTSEIAYWFKFTDGMTANLTFVGDDDVWVYVNRRLAVDLGGLHVPHEGSFTIAANGTVNMVHGLNTGGMPITETGDVGDFGLEDGGVYEVRVFHAERKVTGSSFKLTLSGFNAARSDCAPMCGDGVIAAGEQCDDGAEQNTGGHNRCNADCTITEYCGDGIVQTEQEECDDADPLKPFTCAGCRILVVK